jgi:hypothetical protein
MTNKQNSGQNRSRAKENNSANGRALKVADDVLQSKEVF